MSEKEEVVPAAEGVIPAAEEATQTASLIDDLRMEENWDNIDYKSNFKFKPSAYNDGEISSCEEDEIDNENNAVGQPVRIVPDGVQYESGYEAVNSEEERFCRWSRKHFK